jgi:hypothetical protein
MAANIARQLRLLREHCLICLAESKPSENYLALVIAAD